MVQLICMRCNRANDADAKFCAGCGAALLRKFCGQCHEVNDADSHFCQACGAALPAQASMTPPAVASAPVALETSAAASRPPTYRSPLGFAVAAAVVVVIAVVLWPHSDKPAVVSKAAAPMAPAVMPEVVVPEPPAPVLPAASAPAVVPAETVAAAPVAAAPAPETPTKETTRPATRAPVAVPRAAPVVRAERATPRGSVPAPDCTPQLDALGLCEPGTR